MDVILEVKEKLKRKNQILFDKKSLFLQDLMFLISEQNHKVLTLWALDLALELVNYLEEKYPNEDRFRIALNKTKLWAQGEIKMPEAKRAILNCHAVAKELTNKEDIALCHAIGQACGVVHTVGHAIGLPIYELTAIVYKYGIDNCKDKLINRKKEYIDKIYYYQEHYKEYEKWAKFYN